LADAARRRGCAVAIHNCGDAPYFDAQIRAMQPGIISFAELPDDCASPRELKRRYGRSVMLMGYVSTALLARGTPFEVMEACRRQIDDLAAGGGFLLAPGCEFPPDAPLDNALALVAAARRYG
jgi:uroporphyrinogen decarboxylase